MSALTLFALANNPRSNKVQVAAVFAELPLTTVFVPHAETKSAVHLARNPLGKCPVLTTPQGNLFESNAILRFVARTSNKLYGTSVFEQSLVDQWLDFSTTEVDVLVYPLVVPLLGLRPYDAELATKATQDLAERTKVLEAHFANNKYLVGGALTIADLALASSFQLLYTFALNKNEQAKSPKVLAWYKSVESTAAWRSVYGRTRFLVTNFAVPTQTAVAAKTEEKKEAPKKDNKKDAAKQEKKAPKKEEKKVQEKKVQEDDDGEEKPAKKEKNVLDLLPPSTFDVDSYKREYFLEASVATNMKNLFEKVDVQGWSLWIVRYNKAEGEGNMLLRTRNTMNGFLQRTDPAFKKYSFAVHGVYGDNNNFDIAGAWVWRGTEVPFEMRDHPSFDFHSFTRVDPKNEEQTKLFAEFWLNQVEEESKVEGKTVRAVTYWR